MPHVFIIAAGALGIFLALRWIRREYNRVDASLREAANRIRKTSVAAPKLVFDAASGYYVPMD
jgi:hypothetical protein